jgi:hypothetical protein
VRKDERTNALALPAPGVLVVPEVDSSIDTRIVDVICNFAEPGVMQHNCGDPWAGQRDGIGQALEVSGGLLHAHTAYRDPKLAALSQEELQALDALTRKLALPAPDGPQNQIESNAAIEEFEVLSEGEAQQEQERRDLEDEVRKRPV